MAVTLINPPSLMRNGNAATITPSPPLGLAYLAASVCEEFDVQAIDAIGEAPDQVTAIEGSNYFFQGLSIDQILQRIRRTSQVIGVSCMFTSNWLLHRKLVKAILEEFPDAVVVLGGEHATAAHASILREFPKRVVCALGEGEETFRDLCRVIVQGERNDFSTIQGTASMAPDGQLQATRRGRVRNLDLIPWPKWELFPVHRYLDSGVGATVHNRRVMLMTTSRGCPYQCSFCSARTMWGKYVFYRSPEDIIAEIRKYIDRYQIEHVEFMDLVGLMNRRWTLDFCEKMKAANLGVTFTFSPGSRSEILTPDVLAALKDAGLIRMQYAPDSGSTEEAKLLKKNANLDKLTASIRACAKLEIPICSNILIGYPGQTKRAMFQSVLFALKLAWYGVDDVLVHNFVPYSGSEFREQLENDPSKEFSEYITDEYMVVGTTPSVGLVKSYSSNIPSVLLSGARFFALAACLAMGYVVRPKRIWKSCVRLVQAKPITYFENLVYLKVKAMREPLVQRPKRIVYEEFVGLR